MTSFQRNSREIRKKWATHKCNVTLLLLLTVLLCTAFLFLFFLFVYCYYTTEARGRGRGALVCFVRQFGCNAMLRSNRAVLTAGVDYRRSYSYHTSTRTYYDDTATHASFFELYFVFSFILCILRLVIYM